MRSFQLPKGNVISTSAFRADSLGSNPHDPLVSWVTSRESFNPSLLIRQVGGNRLQAGCHVHRPGRVSPPASHPHRTFLAAQPHPGGLHRAQQDSTHVQGPHSGPAPERLCGPTSVTPASGLLNGDSITFPDPVGVGSTSSQTPSRAKFLVLPPARVTGGGEHPPGKTKQQNVASALEGTARY